MIIGVLALQGAFIEHINMLKRLIVEVVEVRYVSQLSEIDGLIIPGGESSVMSIISDDMLDGIREFYNRGKCIWGICAGLILLSREVLDMKKNGQNTVGILDCVVRRNYFGRQIDSFIADVSFPDAISKKDGETFKAVCIRSPVITNVGLGVQVLVKYNGLILAVKQSNILGTVFHPELTDEKKWHEYFIWMIESNLKV